MKNDEVVMFMGKRVDDLDRGELIRALHFLARENLSLRNELSGYHKHVDWGSYLSEQRPAVREEGKPYFDPSLVDAMFNSDLEAWGN